MLPPSKPVARPRSGRGVAVSVSGLVLLALLLVPGTGGCPENGLSNTDPESGKPYTADESVVAPATLGGTVRIASLTIPAGTTTIVTEDLDLHVTGDVVIDGELIAAAPESGGSNKSNNEKRRCGAMKASGTNANGSGRAFIIKADGDITIGGTVRAGDAETVLSTGGSTGEDGMWGGQVILAGKSRVVIRKTGSIIAGHGSNGVDGTRGGHGGAGGGISLEAGTELIMRGSITLGDGGNGGFATTTPDDLPENGRFSNHGGNSGLLLVKAAHMDWPGLDTRDPIVFQIDPLAYNLNPETGVFALALGGGAGMVQVLDDEAGGVNPLAKAFAARAQDSNGSSGGDSCSPNTGAERCVFAANGGYGWYRGGGGGFADVGGGYTLHERDGVSWTIQAGDGGDVGDWDIPVEVLTGLRQVLAQGAQGGTGGLATIIAASGALSDEFNWHGGNGGSIVVRGGKGGDGENYAGQIGGVGGLAWAHSGDGGDGYGDGCVIGHGGNGGDAEAYGGAGGNGATPGNGGEAFAWAGDGGDGGDGGPRGASGGVGGRQFTKFGADGATGLPGDVIIAGIEFEEQARDGDPGMDDGYCCNCSQ